MVVLCALGDLLEPHAAHAADGVGEVLIHHVLADAHDLEDLGALVGLDGGDAHLRGDFHDAVEHGLVVVVHGHGVVLVEKSLVDELADAGVGQVRVHRPGAVAQERGEVVHVPGLGAL